MSLPYEHMCWIHQGIPEEEAVRRVITDQVTGWWKTLSDSNNKRALPQLEKTKVALSPLLSFYLISKKIGKLSLFQLKISNKGLIIEGSISNLLSFIFNHWIPSMIIPTNQPTKLTDQPTNQRASRMFREHKQQGRRNILRSRHI